MVKRGKLEIMKDILDIINQNGNSIRSTPLMRRSNLSTARFKDYFEEILEKGFVHEVTNRSGERFISLTTKGFSFLEKYKTIVDFIDEFSL